MRGHLLRVGLSLLAAVAGIVAVHSQPEETASPETAAAISPEVTSDPASAPASAPSSESHRSGEERPLVYRFELHDDMIDAATAFYFTRAYRRAEAAGADAIIIDMDTPGGSVGSALEIRNRIIESGIPTYVYISHWAISAGAMIALATDGVYMGPASSIGGAQVITGSGGELPPAVNEKMTSILRSEVRSTIRELARSHPDRWSSEELEYRIQLAEAFITPPPQNIVSIYHPTTVVCSSGELLTMDWDEAVREHIADGRAETFEDVWPMIGLENPEIREVRLTWSENLARFLSRSSISALLLLVGLGGLYLEFKTPGFGVPGVVGFTALALFFFGVYVADLSTFFEPFLVLVGFILLGVEIFVIPGFGLTGVLGILCIFFGLIMAMVKLPPPEFDFSFIYLQTALITLAAGLVGLSVFIILLARYLPRSRLWKYLELEPATIAPITVGMPAGSEATSPAALVGLRGRALTDLRPAGTVELQGQPYDVVTQSEFIPQGTAVRVLSVAGTQIIVVRVPNSPSPGS